MEASAAHPVPEAAEEHAAEAAAKPEIQARSRQLLSSTATVPPWLQAEFPLGNDVILAHVLHKTTTNLPHFQARFNNGAKFDGKTPAQIEKL